MFGLTARRAALASVSSLIGAAGKQIAAETGRLTSYRQPSFASARLEQAQRLEPAEPIRRYERQKFSSSAAKREASAVLPAPRRDLFLCRCDAPFTCGCTGRSFGSR